MALVVLNDLKQFPTVGLSSRACILYITHLHGLFLSQPHFYLELSLHLQ